MKGFDYRAQCERSQSPREWAQAAAAVLAEGGSRRVENGETFVKDARGILQFEVYGNVPLRGQK